MSSSAREALEAVGKHQGHAGGYPAVPSPVPQDTTVPHGAAGLVLSISKSQMFGLLCVPPMSIFKALTQVAVTDAHAVSPFMSPGFKPGLRHNEELGTADNWRNLISSNQGITWEQRGSTLYLHRALCSGPEQRTKPTNSKAFPVLVITITQQCGVYVHVLALRT